MVAWIPAAVVGLLFANYPPLIEGPFRNAANGVDLSLVVAIGLAGILYVATLLAFPEPRYVFGEQGPRWIPTRDHPEPPAITGAGVSASRRKGPPTGKPALSDDPEAPKSV